MIKPEGKILKIKFGYNPNSSSLGTTIVYLLIGTTVAQLILSFVSTVLRLRNKSDDQ